MIQIRFKGYLLRSALDEPPPGPGRMSVCINNLDRLNSLVKAQDWRILVGSQRVAMTTLGCKLNFVDGEEIAERLIRDGYVMVPFGEEADFTIVNTCTVTGRSDFKSRRLISKARRASPGGKIVVTGCYAQLDPARIAALPGVDLVVGHSFQHELSGLLADLEGCLPPLIVVASESTQPTRIIRHHTRLSRAFLRVQNGCNQRCTFCRVWRARGLSVSEPLEAVLQQARVFLDSGFEELVLTGVDMGSWGRDLKSDRGFADLLEILASLEGRFRVRLSSIYPMDIDDKLFDLVTTHPKVCRHLHLPLQSGSKTILQRMGRHISPGVFLELTHRLRAASDRFAIGADIIAGFPGETEDDFQATMQLIMDSALTYLHVFPFSARKGTKAALAPGQLPPELVKERARLLRLIGDKKRSAYRRECLNRDAEILVEKRRIDRIGLLTGFTSDYIRASFEGPDTWMGKLVVFENLPRTMPVE